jgi:hypothetical protein
MSDVPPNYSLLDELLAEDDILDDVVSEVTSVLKANVEALQDDPILVFVQGSTSKGNGRRLNKICMMIISLKILSTLHLFFVKDFACQGHFFCALLRS